MPKQPPQFDSEDKLRSIHHFVPQFYLRRFARTDKSSQIWAYEIGRDPFSPNIVGIAGQRDFYTYTDAKTKKESAELENVFANIDEKGANILNVLDGLQDGFINLPKEHKGDLYYFIAHLHTRNLQQRKFFAEMYAQMSVVQMKSAAFNKEDFHRDAKEALGDNYTEEIAERSRQSFLKGDVKVNYDPMSNHFIGVTLENAQELYFILMKLKKAALVTVTSGLKRFVTSDNPVTHYLENEDPRRKLGVGYINAIFQLPISPTRALLLIDDGYEIDEFECNEEHVKHMNAFTAKYADKWLFSHEDSTEISDLFNKFKTKEPIIKSSSYKNLLNEKEL